MKEPEFSKTLTIRKAIGNAASAVAPDPKKSFENILTLFKSPKSNLYLGKLLVPNVQAEALSDLKAILNVAAHLRMDMTTELAIFRCTWGRPKGPLQGFEE